MALYQMQSGLQFPILKRLCLQNITPIIYILIVLKLKCAFRIKNCTLEGLCSTDMSLQNQRIVDSGGVYRVLLLVMDGTFNGIPV